MKSRLDTPTIGMVVLQPTPFCNINCSYCYLPQRSDKTVMADATLRAAFERGFASGWASDDLSVIWHAGEPLVVSPAFCARAPFDANQRHADLPRMVRALQVMAGRGRREHRRTEAIQ